MSTHYISRPNTDHVTEAERQATPSDRAQANTPPAPTLAIAADQEVRPTANRFANPSDEPPTQRDGELLCTLARLRLLTYGQVKRQFFAGRTAEAVGKRMRRLASLGWVSIWDQPIVRGGRPCWVLPTPLGLAWAHDRLRCEATGQPYEPLVRLLLPRRPAPLTLPPDAVPPWLAHQKEVNHLAQSFAEAGALRWVSSLERPFPSAIDGVVLPQPDLVLAFEAPHGYRLVFLEHDRGMEAPAHFRKAKVERYADLAARPAVCERLFGTSRFEVWVSVIDKRFRRPFERLRTLTSLAVAEGAEELFRFTLGGWASAFPAGRIWFVGGEQPEHDELQAGAHPNLVGAFGRGDRAASVGDPHQPAWPPREATELTAAVGRAHHLTVGPPAPISPVAQ